MIYDDDGFLNKTIPLNFSIYLFLIFSGRKVVVSMVMYFVSFFTFHNAKFVCLFFLFLYQTISAFYKQQIENKVWLKIQHRKLSNTYAEPINLLAILKSN